MSLYRKYLESQIISMLGGDVRSHDARAGTPMPPSQYSWIFFGLNLDWSKLYPVAQPTLNKGKFLETVEEESIADEMEILNDDPYGFCNTDRDDDECMSDSLSNFDERDLETDYNLDIDSAVQCNVNEGNIETQSVLCESSSNSVKAHSSNNDKESHTTNDASVYMLDDLTDHAMEPRNQWNETEESNEGIDTIETDTYTDNDINQLKEAEIEIEPENEPTIKTDIYQMKKKDIEIESPFKFETSIESQNRKQTIDSEFDKIYEDTHEDSSENIGYGNKRHEIKTVEDFTHPHSSGVDEHDSDLLSYMKEIEAYGKYSEGESLGQKFEDNTATEEKPYEYQTAPAIKVQLYEDGFQDEANFQTNPVPTFNIESYEEEGVIIQKQSGCDMDENSEGEEKQNNAEKYADDLAYLEQSIAMNVESFDDAHEAGKNNGSDITEDVIGQRHNKLNAMEYMSMKMKIDEACKEVTMSNDVFENNTSYNDECNEQAENDDGYKSDSSCGRVVETPVLKCTDDTSKEATPVVVDSYKTLWRKTDQENYNFNTDDLLTAGQAVTDEIPAPCNQDEGHQIKERNCSCVKCESKIENSGNLLAVGDEMQTRRRSGSIGVVARRRSIFEIDDQEKLLGAEVDPLAETIIILTNAEKIEMERKKEESGKLEAGVVLRNRSGSYGKGLVANRRSAFESEQ